MINGKAVETRWIGSRWFGFRRYVGRIVAVLLTGVVLTQSVAMGTESPAKPSLAAACAILVDAQTGRILYEKNPNDKRAIASITKLMTALVAVRSTPDLTQEVAIKREYTLAEGSSMYLQAGETLTLETLLYGLLLVSGNDAALAIADFCAGDVETFVGWMNDWAKELGMKNTHFANPNGLPNDDHYSTAADMAKLARVVMEDEGLAKIVATKSITIGTRSMTNHNKLLWQYEGCVGMKTGYTDKAGRTLVSCAERDGQRLIVVTLNDPDDWRDHTALFDYGFAQYPSQMLALSGRAVRSLAVTDSLVRLVSVATTDDVYYPLLSEEKVTSKITLPESVSAPVRKGDIAGEMTFFLNGKEIGKTYLEYSVSIPNNAPRGKRLLERLQEFLQGSETDNLAAALCGAKKL